MLSATQQATFSQFPSRTGASITRTFTCGPRSASRTLSAFVRLGQLANRLAAEAVGHGETEDACSCQAAGNINPSTVDYCLESDEVVKEPKIIGLPDEQGTQTVKAIIVVDDGPTLTETEGFVWCRLGMAGYKQRHSLESFDEPRPVNHATGDDASDENLRDGAYAADQTRVR